MALMCIVTIEKKIASVVCVYSYMHSQIRMHLWSFILLCTGLVSWVQLPGRYSKASTKMKGILTLLCLWRSLVLDAGMVADFLDPQNHCEFGPKPMSRQWPQHRLKITTVGETSPWISSHLAPVFTLGKHRKGLSSQACCLQTESKWSATLNVSE